MENVKLDEDDEVWLVIKSRFLSHVSSQTQSKISDNIWCCYPTLSSLLIKENFKGSSHLVVYAYIVD